VKLLIHHEKVGKLARHFEHVIDLLNQVASVLAGEVVVVGLKHEKFVDSGSLADEEAADLLGL
jgi:hypothetical protein